MKDSHLKKSGLLYRSNFPEPTPVPSLTPPQPTKLSLFERPTYLDGHTEIGTPSTMINGSQFSSRQSNVRGFFMREQMQKDERQNEIRRRTKEILDQQILEKKNLQLQNSRELQIQRYQESNLMKQSSMIDQLIYNNENKSRCSVVNQNTVEGMDFTRQNRTNTHAVKREQIRFDESDHIHIKEIMKENDQLKFMLNEKQHMIESLIRQRNVRELALIDVQEAEGKVKLKSNSHNKRLNYLSPSTQVSREQDNNRKETLNRHKLTIPHRRPNFNQVFSLSNNTQQSNFVTSAGCDDITGEVFGSSLTGHDSNLNSCHSSQEVQTVNNFTFANNLVDKLKKQQNLQQREAKLKILKEFSQANLKRKFCV